MTKEPHEAGKASVAPLKNWTTASPLELAAVVMWNVRPGLFFLQRNLIWVKGRTFLSSFMAVVVRKTCLLLIPRYEFFTGRRDGGVELLNTSLETRSQPPEITQGSDLSCQPTSRQHRRYQHGTRTVSVYIKFKTTPRNLVSSRVNSLRSWRYCVGARLKFWQRSCVPKKGSRDEVVEIPSRLRPSWLLRRQISLNYYTIPPATQAIE